MKADATHCIQHAPLTHKETCRLLEERLHIMGKQTRVLEASASCAGKSILEMMNEELDRLVGLLMTDWSTPPEEGDDEEWLDYGEVRGQAQGVAMCIAFVLNPYHPNIEAVKDDALERYAAAEAEVATKKRKKGKGKKG